MCISWNLAPPWSPSPTDKSKNHQPLILSLAPETQNQPCQHVTKQSLGYLTFHTATYKYLFLKLSSFPNIIIPTLLRVSEIPEKNIPFPWFNYRNIPDYILGLAKQFVNGMTFLTKPLLQRLGVTCLPAQRFPGPSQIWKPMCLKHKQ